MIDDIEALVLGNKTFQLLVLLGTNGTNFVRGKNLVSVRDGPRQMGSFDACRKQQLNYSYFSKDKL